jgi:hypothetical protein
LPDILLQWHKSLHIHKTKIGAMMPITTPIYT